ncbi:serine hydroxymethyltransferase [Amycolatopsis rhizosphaerae]|uniref:Serine hydroxymethyltransferase n=1 Tax=Amycolatopsis rhizosphaerae TaxID=2053003 RepID=A0A558DNQ1_9PSEU|nr:serine hydroxymethyltransferase [Amycolatopsis rhizosphaerae]TVT62637.1 serine hydroxymethyltransferase [Amycolatopsis rhizosphaerae]
MPVKVQTGLLDRTISEVDPAVAAELSGELLRQQSTLSMIASENYTPLAVMTAQGSAFMNKLAEGYADHRYCSGCEHIDVIEKLATQRAKALFGAEHANVQPHSGAQANAAAYAALLEPGDTILAMDLAHGGHLTHGMRLNFSAQFYNCVNYHVNEADAQVDMDEVARLAREHRPKLIVAGWSAYSRRLDFAAFRAIADEVGARFLVDMAHFAGLVAAGEHPNPVPYADVVTTTTHKTLGGPRGGLVLCRERFAKAIDSAVFPGQQAAPLAHTIAAKAVAFKIAAGEEFRDIQRRTIEGARIVAERLAGSDLAAEGIKILTGGTDVHLLLVDLRESELTGKQAEDRLKEIGISVNRNTVPFDPRPPMVTSGLRIGTAALATRGFAAEDFRAVADIIADTLISPVGDESTVLLRDRVATLAGKYPLYESAR